MAIKEEEQKKNGMKISDNMDGEKRSDEKLMAGANGTVNISKYKKWKKLYESGGNMRKAGLNITKKELELFLKLYKKRN